MQLEGINDQWKNDTRRTWNFNWIETQFVVIGFDIKTNSIEGKPWDEFYLGKRDGCYIESGEKQH